mmetsp:Transcript_24397/g.50720  ORF Transcript_24397/g.50720 Transcript_24397/m.50720 type:complete len:152 (-) Transcript_24397:1033-1488(-)
MSEPTTILVMLGPLHFDHSGDADVLSVKISTPEEIPHTLAQAKTMLKPASVENFHLVLKSSSISSLFEDRIVTSFSEALQPHAEVSVHILGPEYAPVQQADADEIRYSLVMMGLRMEEEGRPEGDDSGWALKARVLEHEDAAVKSVQEEPW